nr:cadmium resistance transporter [Armatimonadota bacterium]
MDQSLLFIWIAIAAYASTNMDNLLVLLVFFSDKSFNAREIIIGEYLGILALLAVSVTAAFTASFVPAGWIGLMGLLPLTIGIRKLLIIRREPGEDDTKQYQVEKTSFLKLTHSRILAVALVTISNGGDNVGVYVPLFASSGHPRTLVLVLIFLALTGLWCAAAYY